MAERDQRPALPGWWPDQDGLAAAGEPGEPGCPVAYYGFVISGELDIPLFATAVQRVLASRHGGPDGTQRASSACMERGDGLAWLLSLPVDTIAGPDVAQVCAQVAATYRALLASHGRQGPPGSQPVAPEAGWDVPASTELDGTEPGSGRELSGSEPGGSEPGAGEDEDDLRFWRRELAGAPAMLSLPTDWGRSPGRSLRARSLKVDLPDLRTAAGPAAGSTASCRAASSQAFDRLLAAVAVLLFRMTGDSDIVLGARPPVTSGGAPTVPVPVRVQVADDLTFGELLRRVRDTLAAAVAHGGPGTGRIAAELGLPKQAGCHPVFGVLVEDRQAISEALRLPGASVRSLPASARWSPYDLQLTADLAEPASAELGYSTGLFDEATVLHLGRALRCLLRAAAESPGTRVADLPLLHGADQDEVIGLNRTPRPPLRPVTLARPADPGDLAIIDAERGSRVSYAELRARAEQFAGLLWSAGARPGSTVGLHLPRSADAIAAIFAALRIGAAYLPLDAGHPPERVKNAIAEVAPHAIVTSRALAAKLGPLGVPLVIADAPEGGREPAQAVTVTVPEIDVPLDSVAYVMYTSGSTGQPRAVQVPHRGLAGYVRAAVNEYGLGARDRVLQFCSLGFDVSAEELFPCLSVGGTLVLRSTAMIASPEDFAAELAEHGVTAVHLPASYFHELAAHLTVSPLRPPPSLRLVAVGGEPVAPAHARAWLRWTGPDARLVNVYGITETTIVTTMADLTEQTVPEPDGAGTCRIPVGRPIEGTEVYLLDEQLRPVPPGFAGEICIAGAGLARGYLGRPGATAQRFVPHPFADGERLYRSGDIGRLRADGTLECLGRVDRQVKLHGYRIELGEVEAALCRVREVDEAAVTVRPDRLGRDCLVAHVTLATRQHAHAGERHLRADEGHVRADELRAALAAMLPSYMVPAAITVLDEMPHSAHDKIDYSRLPDPDVAASDAEPPADPAEKAVALAWQEVLDLAAIGRGDNFFELGGHSLSAMQVTTILRDVFGPQLAVTVLFENPRLADFAIAAAACAGPHR